MKFIHRSSVKIFSLVLFVLGIAVTGFFWVSGEVQAQVSPETCPIDTSELDPNRSMDSNSYMRQREVFWAYTWIMLNNNGIVLNDDGTIRYNDTNEPVTINASDISFPCARQLREQKIRNGEIDG